VSIAVMNWVWANSPTSGNERLVLLALADACSRDDGTGCWLSIPSIRSPGPEFSITVNRRPRSGRRWLRWSPVAHLLLVLVVVCHGLVVLD
jgi:hypothetical protein